MKTILLELIVLLIFSGTLTAQEKTFTAGFTGMHPNRFNYTLTGQIDWDWYNELNVNTWQGWWIGDQEIGVVDKLDDYGINGYFQPDTLRWLGFGKVVIHEAEETDNNNQPVGRFRYNYHFCGQDITDNTSFGSGARVRYYDKNVMCNQQNPSGWILTGMNENGVQSFSGENNDPMYECAFPGRGPWLVTDKWYIKPRMRINVYDTVGPPRPVIKVVINSYEGSFLDSISLFTNDFRCSNNTAYDGRYLEDYQ